MFFWTVERYDADADTRFAGMYVSGAYQPTGAGSRSGRARTWQLVNDSLGGHELRKDAKARAQRLYRAWRDGHPRPWR